MKYFAYGANMFSPILAQVLPDITFAGIAKAKGYQLHFHKIGNQDESGKCNIVSVPDTACVIYGVLFDIPTRYRHVLDRAERLGYGNQEVTLKVYPQGRLNGGCEDASGVFAFTYVAHQERVKDDLLPYTWYKNLVVNGAKEHDLPIEYIQQLESYVAINDPNTARAQQFDAMVMAQPPV